jgi:MFS family permease
VGSLWDRETGALIGVPAFRCFALSRACTATGSNLFQAALLWQVYALSGSPVDLGIVGLVRFVPIIALSLVAGAAADTYDRRRVLLLAQLAPFLGAVALLYAIASNALSLPVLYAMSFVAGAAIAFDGPARQGIIPMLVPRRLFRSAIVANQTVQASTSMMGPALAGVLIAWRGAEVAFAVYAALMAAAMVALVPIRVNASPEASARRGALSLRTMFEGLAFLKQRRVLLGIMTLDLLAVIFGGARALLPVYAVDVLHAGATGYGILSAASEVGSLLCALALLVLPKPSQTGRAMLITVSAYGIATVLFGLSTSLPLAVLFYAATGVADQVSVVMRHTSIQLSTPDELRGRVTAVNSIFTNSSVQIGAMESGFVAGLSNAVFSVVSGGAAVLLVVGVLAWLIPELRTFRAQPAPVQPLQKRTELRPALDQSPKVYGPPVRWGRRRDSLH